MPKIAASLVFPVSSPPVVNAVVEVDSDGTILSVSRGRPGFSEMAGVAYFSGMLVPGLVDVMCDSKKGSLWLLSRGVRVGGLMGVPGDEQGRVSVDVDGGRATWRSVYGGMVDYRIYSGAYFSEHFRPLPDDGSGTDGEAGIYRFSHPGSGLDVMASHGRCEMLELMIRIQTGENYPLPALLAMATINGARALGCEKDTGSIERGKRPGLSIIEGADIMKMRLLPGSRLTRLF